MNTPDKTAKCIHLIQPAYWCCICKLQDLKNLQAIKAAAFEEGRAADKSAPNPYAE